MVPYEVDYMLGNLKEYMVGLPESMTLKKKVIKAIMKSKEPLAQKELMDLLATKDWTNVKRVIRDLLDQGLIIKKVIGTKEYYVKVEVHKQGKQFVDGNTVYYVDIFEPNYEGEEKYVRIKQTEKRNRDNYEVVGKITFKLSKIKNFITSFGEIYKLIQKK